MREKLFKIYLQEEFNPKFIGLFLPGYFMAKAMYANISNLIPKLSGKLLDIGCGSQPLKSLFSVEDHKCKDVFKITTSNSCFDALKIIEGGFVPDYSDFVMTVNDYCFELKTAFQNDVQLLVDYLVCEYNMV